MAELRDILENNDFRKVVTSSRVGSKLSRYEIEKALTENGIAIPDRKVSFELYDGRNMFLVFWHPDEDTFFTEKLRVSD